MIWSSAEKWSTLIPMLRAEEKASGITPEEPTEWKNLLEQIIALEESAEAENQGIDREKSRKVEINRGKAEDVRLKAMEKLSHTQKRQSGEVEGSQSKRPCCTGSDAVSYLSQRAQINYELRQEELKLKKRSTAVWETWDENFSR